jgi:hypothetical protein
LLPTLDHRIPISLDGAPNTFTAGSEQVLAIRDQLRYEDQAKARSAPPTAGSRELGNCTSRSISPESR